VIGGYGGGIGGRKNDWGNCEVIEGYCGAIGGYDRVNGFATRRSKPAIRKVALTGEMEDVKDRRVGGVR